MSMRLASAGRSSGRDGWRAVVEADTAGAAREIAESGDRPGLRSLLRLAAELYGLDILAENVEDAEHNTTRFVILSRENLVAPANNGPVVTSFVFRVRNLPAALYKALGGFATNGVNMTKLKSYQLEGQFFASQFYAEVEGHPDDRRAQTGARGTRLLFGRALDPWRLPGEPVPGPDPGAERRQEELTSASFDRF